VAARIPAWKTDRHGDLSLQGDNRYRFGLNNSIETESDVSDIIQNMAIHQTRWRGPMILSFDDRRKTPLGQPVDPPLYQRVLDISR